MYITDKDIENFDRVRRLNIINSVSGIKPANLIGTVDGQGRTNVAIFSSVVHMSSHPPLLGFMLRPSGEVRRHTYENIMENGHYTINHIHESFIAKAHYTSAKFDKNVSEFDTCALTPEYIADFPAPFVKESHLKIGMEFLQQIPIKLNDTSLIIGKIKSITVPDEAVNEIGRIDLSVLKDVGISGLNTYYALNKLQEFPYARVHEVPNFE